MINRLLIALLAPLLALVSACGQETSANTPVASIRPAPPSKAGATVCATADPSDQPTPSHWQRFAIAASRYDYGTYLLGLHGERVLAGPTEASITLADAYPPHPDLWIEQVDWAAYSFTAQAGEPAVALYFDTDSKNQRHLCRVEKQTLVAPGFDPATDAEDGEEAKQPARPAVIRASEIDQLRYDAGNRLIAVEHLARGEDSDTWSRGATATCYQYTETGNLASVAAVDSGRCAEAKPGDVHTHYVYADANRLLRRIATEFRTEEVDGQFTDVAHPIVDLFNAQGHIVARYLEDNNLRPYREADKAEGGDIAGTWVIDEKELRAFQFLDWHWPAANRKWQVILTPRSEASDFVDSDYPRLAQGKTDGKGMVRFGKAASAIRTALQDPEKSVVFNAETQSFLLVPQVSDERWAACRNPDATTPDACP